MKLWKIELAESFSGSELWVEAETIEDAIKVATRKGKVPTSKIVNVVLMSSSPVLR